MLSALRTQDAQLKLRKAGYEQLPPTATTSTIKQETLDHIGIRHRRTRNRDGRLRCVRGANRTVAFEQ